jgi:branched-chain amino acid transport system substrate-binding protein
MKGAELAINEINAAGGVKLGGKKVQVEAVVRDDETKGDVAVRRFKELRDEVKVAGLVGSTFAPIAKALNNQIVNEPLMVSSCVARWRCSKKNWRQLRLVFMAALMPSGIPGLRILLPN